MSITSSLHLAQAALSAYTLYPTYLSITRTQTYEATTEKLAKYSNIAEWHLWKTRKTLGFGTVGVITSFLTSTYLTLNPVSASNPRASNAAVSFALAGALVFSHSHISNYWRGKAKVPAPGMSEYNDAISSTNLMRRCIGILATSWVILGIVYAGQAFR